MNCLQAVSVCPDIRHGKRSRFPRCLSPLFIYHPLVLSWPVNCWPVSASLASLAWPMPVYWPVDSARIVTAGKMLFPTAVFESGPVWTKYFLRLSCDPFFQTLVRCRFINCWCWYFANNSAQEAENGLLEAQDCSCRLETQSNKTKSKEPLHFYQFQ